MPPSPETIEIAAEAVAEPKTPILTHKMKGAVDLARTSATEILSQIQPENQPMTWALLAIRRRLNQGLPSPETMLEMAAKDPEGALEYADFYAHEDWAEPIIRKATLAKPIHSLRHSHHYKTQTWAKDIVRLAAGLNPQDKKDVEHRQLAAVDHSDRYCDQPWAKDILLELCPIIPGHILKNGHRFMDQPWCDEVRECAYDNLKKNASTFF